MKRRIIGTVLSTAMLAGMFSGINPASVGAATWSANTTGTPQYMETQRRMEELNRGLIAVYRTVDSRSVLSGEGGVYLSWRLLGTESLTNQAFDIYRSTSASGTFTKIATTGVHDATNYIDTSGTTSNYYKVVKAGATTAEVAAEDAVQPGTNYTAKGSEVGSGASCKNSYTYVDIPISRPDAVTRYDGKTSYYYSYDSDHEGGANDASVGDLDGDGDYEIVLKWDPTDSKDSAGADYTGRVFIDGYEISTSSDNLMWRIDLGPNVTAGAHYTQYIVYDFDGDGKSEIAMTTAPGSVDGQGNYVSEVGDTDDIRNVDNTKSYIGTSGKSKGKNLGPEYYTIFDGETGAALYTTAAIPLGTSSEWGDSKYNRAYRFLAGVAYLDGVTPCYIACRGYYNKAVLRAYSWDGTDMNLLWEHMGNVNDSSTMYGQGNHNLSIADIDNDGCDEIVYGSACLDSDGKTILGNTRLGHGDAMHVNDFNNDGVQEVFSVKEESSGYKKYAMDLRTAKNGTHFWESGKVVTSGDNGRGVMDNIDDDYAKTHSNALAIGWDSGHDNAIDLNGDDVAAKPSFSSRSACNFLVYWDGDLGREIMDDTIIGKYDADTGSTTRFYSSNGYTLTGSSSNNFSKYNPCLSVDLWGDWREEVIMSVNKSSSTEQAYLRIFTSTLPTDYRLTTLMHDCQYREAIAWQNVGYNQPPHTSYYIGSAALATDSDGNEMNYLAPATLFTNVAYETESVPVTGITLSDHEFSVEITKSASISASLQPENATKKKVIWTSSDESVATVSGGIIKGISEGTATITATTKDGGYTDSCVVTVYKNDVTGVTISTQTMDVGVGYTKTLSATVQPSNATIQDVSWQSSDESVATVDQNGVVTGVANGTAVITVVTEDGGCTDSCTVSVLPLTTEDVTGDNVFETSNTDSETTLSSTATSASFSQTAASVGGEFHKDFTAYSDNRATISFTFKTGGKKLDGSNWNWDGHEYTFGLQFLDTEGDNILTLSQSYQSSAQATTYKTLENDEGYVSSWSSTGTTENNPLGRSSTTWYMTLEFDYDNDECIASLTGGSQDITYTNTFSLDGASFKTLKYYTTIDGDGTITVGPSLSDLVYERTELVQGEVPTAKPTSAPTATPKPTASPTPSPAPVENSVTSFTAKSRITVSEEDGTVTFTNTSNANNAYAAAYADISDLIEGYDSYVVEYDSYLSSSSRARIALVDASSRPGSSSKDSYDKTKVAFVQGVTNSTTYAVNEDKNTYGNLAALRDQYVNTRIEVDAANKTVSVTLTDSSGTEKLNKTIDYLDADTEINGIEFFDTINSSVGYMKNIKVTTYEPFTVDAKLIIASHGSDGALESVTVSDYVYDGTTDDIELSEGQTAYLWDGLDTMRSICEPIEK